MKRDDLRARVLESGTTVAWLRNSLRHRRDEFRRHANRCHAAYRTDPMMSAARLLANIYDGWASEMQRELDLLTVAGADEE